MALYVFKSAVRMSNGPKDVLKAVGNRVGALMAEPGEPATFRIGPLTFQTSIVRRIFAAYGQVKVVTDDNYYIFKQSKGRKNMTANEFFQNVNWTLFYQEKMALCELIDHFQGSDDIKEQHAIEWLNGLLNMMDVMGDTAESLGLFEYPERDENDRCFDDRFNDVLLKLPEEND